MTKAFLKIIDVKMLVILFFTFIASPLLCGKDTYTVCLVYSHYLTVYLNNVFLLMIYQYAYRLNQLAYPLMIRIGQKIFYISSYLFIVGLGILYNLIIYISYYFFFGAILPQDLLLTICFMVSNLMICGLECSIVYLQLGKKKNFMYLALPILMNFIFHFTWIRYI